MDTSLLDMLDQMAPDLMEDMRLRALVLERVGALGPIGRRALAARLHLAEREVRSAAEELKRAGCLVQNASGMELSARGEKMTEIARIISRGRRSAAQMESALENLLNVERVRVVPGDADEEPEIAQEIGREAMRQMDMLMEGTRVLAVCACEKELEAAGREAQAERFEQATVVAAECCTDARGYGQANAAAAHLAAHLGAECRLLHLPAGLSSAALAELSQVEQVREALALLHQADVVLYRAEIAGETARRYGRSEAECEAVRRSGAAAGALGLYFDAQGLPLGGENPLVRAQALGTKHVCAMLAYGGARAEAVVALCRHHRHRLLIVDEGAAQRIIQRLR